MRSDRIPSEALKIALNISKDTLHLLFQKIWQAKEESIHQKLKEHLVKLPDGDINQQFCKKKKKKPE